MKHEAEYGQLDVQAVIRAPYCTLRAALSGLCSRPRAQEVHDARIAIRRIQTISSALSPVIPASTISRLRHGLKGLAHELGVARDAHVRAQLLTAMLQDAHAVTLPATQVTAQTIAAKNREAQRRLPEKLNAASLTGLMQLLAQLIEDATPVSPLGLRGDELLAKALKREWKKLTRDIAQHDDAPHKLHELRIRVKTCRYLLDCYRADPDSATMTCLHKLQDCLGDLHDIDQTRHWLRDKPFKNPTAKTLKAQLRSREKESLARLKHLRKRVRDLEQRSITDCIGGELYQTKRSNLAAAAAS